MSHTLQAIAWTLLHFCWQATAVALVYSLGARLAREKASQLRYGLAVAALVAMLGAAVVTFAVEITPVSHLTALAASENSSVDTPHLIAPDRSFADAVAAELPSTVADRIPSFMFWIDVLWLLGVCGLSFRHFGGWWMIRRLSNAATELEASASLRERYNTLTARLRLHRTVLLRVSGAIAGPVTVGVFRSVILLPLSALSGLSEDELELVLAHELAHVKRADFLWNLLQCTAETIFFFHPAVWWLSARIRHERELSCDDLALEVCPNPIAYASALFRLEEQRTRQLHLAMALDGHQPGRGLRMRIARILGHPEALPVRPKGTFSLVSVLAGAVVVLLSAPHVVASLHPTPVNPVSAPQQTASADLQTSATEPSTSALTMEAPSTGNQKPPAAKKQETAAMHDGAGNASQETTGNHESYIDRMKAAGYGDDLDKLIAMKIQGVTPEYARALAEQGFGKPSADDLISCKVQGVSPEVIAQLKQQGFEIKSLQDAISLKIFEVTPEFVSGMKAAGFTGLDTKQLVSLRVQGVTPEYARTVTQQFAGATIDDIIQTRIFNIDGEFIASAKAHGFKDLTLSKLVQLRISGILDEEEK